MARLSHSGSTSALRKKLFPNGFAGNVMRLILETWDTFSIPKVVSCETSITALFRKALIAAYDDGGRKWLCFVSLEEPCIEPNLGTQDGRNDIRFYPPSHARQTIFFTAECKRLHVNTASGFKSLANKYVDEGVIRFAEGKYSSGLPCGGMIGYVMDDRMDQALQSVLREIEKKKWRSRLRLRAKAKTPSGAIQSHRWSIDTEHRRSDGRFTMHHLLLGVRARRIL